MHKQAPQLITFLFLFGITLLLFLFHSQMTIVTDLLSQGILPLQKTAFEAFAQQHLTEQDKKKLAENINQQSEATKYKTIINENAALKDQFSGTAFPSQHLLPATIIGMPRFVPGLSQPETLILDKGTNNGVKSGMPVVIKNILIGQVTTVTSSRVEVTLITNPNISFTAKTLSTNALGIAKGQGGGKLAFENVELSDKLQKNDTVVTKGNEDLHGGGFPPDLLIGTITAVNKVPTALFQSAALQRPFDVTKLSEVFIILE